MTYPLGGWDFLSVTTVELYGYIPKTCAFSLYCLYGAPALANAEIIRLHNNSIVEGKIIKEDNLFVELEVKAGKIKIPPYLSLRKKNAKAVKMKSQVICFNRDGKAYRIQFLGTEEQFVRHKNALKRMLKTLRFTN